MQEAVAGPVKNPDIERRFTHNTLIKNQPDLSARLQEAAKGLAYVIDQATGDSREKSLAITKLEECVFWAHSAIARN